MSAQSWVQALITSQIAGSGPSNSTTAATTLPASAKFSFPANVLQIGTAIRYTMTGQVSNVATTPGTLTLDLRIGAVIAFNSAAMQMSTTAHTTLPLWWDVLLTCRAIGASTSANLMGQSRCTGQMISATAVADSTTTHGTLLAPNAAPAVGTGFDSTAAALIDNFATFSVSTSATNITSQQAVLELLN